MMDKRKKRLLQVEERTVALPLTPEFLEKNNLQANDIVAVDEDLLAQALTKMSQQDILEDVLARLGGFADEE